MDMRAAIPFALGLLTGCGMHDPVWLKQSTPSVMFLKLRLPDRAFASGKNTSAVMILPACASCTAIGVETDRILRHAKTVDAIVVMGPRAKLPKNYSGLELVAGKKLMFSEELSEVSPLVDRYTLSVLSVTKEGQVVHQSLIP
jgi:hypothetical protein